MSFGMSLQPSYYEALKRLTLELAGINLGDDHAFLIETRLTTLARKEGYDDLSQLIDDLFAKGQSRLAVQVVSSLLERDTHFNPDPASMKILEEFLLPNLYSLYKGAKIRLLSFGCSSGQEPCSMAILVDKFLKEFPDIEIEIVAVDYPSPALDRAIQAKYTHFEVQRGLPIRDLITYFDRLGEDWILKPELRRRIDYQEFHLLSNMESLGTFHVVLFRNSLPHYSSAAQVRVLRSLSSVVRPGGYLVLGSKEDAPEVTYGFDAVEKYSNILRRRIPPVEPESEPERPPVVEFVPDEKRTA